MRRSAEGPAGLIQRDRRRPVRAETRGGRMEALAEHGHRVQSCLRTEKQSWEPPKENILHSKFCIFLKYDYHMYFEV